MEAGPRLTAKVGDEAYILSYYPQVVSMILYSYCVASVRKAEP